jgi:hypothetical protein
MKFFGDYLVEKKLISEETLADALVRQVRALPSTAEVVHEKKLISPEKLLQIFRLQTKTHAGFIEAASELKAWSDQIQTEVEDHLATIRPPLGQVLVESGKMTAQQIMNALDEFISERDSLNKSNGHGLRERSERK